MKHDATDTDIAEPATTSRVGTAIKLLNQAHDLIADEVRERAEGDTRAALDEAADDIGNVLVVLESMFP